MLDEVHIYLTQSGYGYNIKTALAGEAELTCLEQTTQTRYKLPSLPIGVVVPVAPSMPENSLLAAEEGVAGRESAIVLLLLDADPWPVSVLGVEPGA